MERTPPTDSGIISLDKRASHIDLPAAAKTQFTPDLRICRVLNGLWQVSGAHGPIDRQAASRTCSPTMMPVFTTWDLADHYGPAEDFIGEFRDGSPRSAARRRWRRCRPLPSGCQSRGG